MLGHLLRAFDQSHDWSLPCSSAGTVGKRIAVHPTPLESLDVFGVTDRAGLMDSIACGLVKNGARLHTLKIEFAEDDVDWAQAVDVAPLVHERAAVAVA